jgi:hypothetical protein
MPLKIEDLTKEELISLLHRVTIDIPDNLIRRVRHETLLAQVRSLSEEAQREMKENTGDPFKIGQYLEASKKFDRAMKLLHDQASEILKD